MPYVTRCLRLSWAAAMTLAAHGTLALYLAISSRPCARLLGGRCPDMHVLTAALVTWLLA